jgi:hypothetical protein
MVGHVSLCQLLANACIVACRVASYPCVGVLTRLADLSDCVHGT